MRILFVADRSPSGFVYADRRALESVHDVHAIHFRWSRRCIVEVLARVRQSDAVLCWFAGHHTYLAVLAAKLLGKRVVVNSADYDLADEKWFGYGSMRGGVRARVNNHIFKLADSVLVTSRFSYDLAVRNTILATMRHKLRVTPLGFEDGSRVPAVKERWMTTVGAVSSENWIRKGLREFVGVAKLLPDVSAFLAGKLREEKLAGEVRSTAPANLRITGFLNDAELNALLARSKVYAQLSYMEGFGASLAEAMVARCVPVVTRQGSLPEVVGDCGYYVDYGDLEHASEAVRVALSDKVLGERARQRVLDCFPMEKRRNALCAALAGVAVAEKSAVAFPGASTSCAE